MVQKKVSKYEVKPVRDPCGLLREFYSSANISIAHDTVTGEAEKHMHHVMEEYYYVERGHGQLMMGDEVLNINGGDLIAIPKNTWHALQAFEGVKLEVLVITHPKYDPRDVILAK